MTNTPLVSILVPSYNHEQYLQQCLDSILRQTYKNIELIIIDDGSSDKSGSIIEKFMESTYIPGSFLAQENIGITKTLNKMLGMASGKYIKLLASDDVLNENGIEHLVNFATRSHGEFDIVFGDTLDSEKPPENIGEKNWKNLNVRPGLGHLAAEDVTSEFTLCFYDFMIVGSLIRTNYLRSLGGFDQDINFEDWPFYLRAIKEGVRAGYTPHTVIFRRRHNSNLSLDWYKFTQGLNQIIFKYKEVDVTSDENISIAMNAVYKVNGSLPTQVSDLTRNKKIIGWGSGKAFKNAHSLNAIKFSYLVDSNPVLWGKFICGLQVKAPQDLLNEKEDTFVLVFSMYYIDIYETLDSMGFVKLVNYW